MWYYEICQKHEVLTEKIKKANLKKEFALIENDITKILKRKKTFDKLQIYVIRSQ